MRETLERLIPFVCLLGASALTHYLAYWFIARDSFRRGAEHSAEAMIAVLEEIIRVQAKQRKVNKK